MLVYFDTTTAISRMAEAIIIFDRLNNKEEKQFLEHSISFIMEHASIESGVNLSEKVMYSLCLSILLARGITE